MKILCCFMFSSFLSSSTSFGLFPYHHQSLLQIFTSDKTMGVSTYLQDHTTRTTIKGQEDETGNDHIADVSIPSFITSPVLRIVYPDMIRHIGEYGNPNIPLGSTPGKHCKTIRRLAFEKKLTSEELNFLNDLNFRFNSLDDLFEEADFDDCLARLVNYEKENKNNFQIPKKYKPDPELGAWVTVLRRIGRDNIESEKREKLEKVEFSWVSTRKCGSTFMKSYRSLKERLITHSRVNDEGIWEVVDEEGVASVLEDKVVKRWLRAQKDVYAKGLLNEARCNYLDQLPGFDWRQI